MKEAIITVMVNLAACVGIAGLALIGLFPILACGLILAAYVSMRWLCNRWDFNKGNEDE